MANFGQIPLPSNSVILSCNQRTCVDSSVIRLTNKSKWGQNGSWYIAVYSNVSQIYGIWFNKYCPTNCVGNRGKCVSTGMCSCRYGWTGLDCTGYHGLSQDMISLVIVGVLVGAALVLSLIITMVMRPPSSNDYYVFASKDYIAMGGGGNSRHAFYLDSDFSWGTSEVSQTFLNRRLSSTEEFTCIDVEVWGIENTDD